MPIDERTPRLDLEKPAQTNTLKNDVERLRDSLDKLDAKVAMLDPATGKIKEDQIADSVARLTQAGLLRDDQIPTQIPLMDQNGHIPVSVIPHDAKTNLYDVSSEVLMLDLDASLGDIARITQPPYSRFILTAPDPTLRENWREIPLSAVTAVNTRTGDVVVAEAGENNDITSLNALTGPLRLGGDGTGDYDAVTMRQLKAASGVGQGANMSGVMNNFIGAVEWFNGSRAALPAGYIPADGQLESRTDAKTADLWAAISNGLLVSVDDAKWIENPAANPAMPYQRVGNRGSYSTGNGSTNFRVPDLNGIRRKGDTNDGVPFTGEHSIVAPFLRGDGGGGTNGIFSAGAVNANGAPDITGYWPGTTPSQFQNGAGGAVNGTGPDSARFNNKSGTPTDTAWAPNSFGLDFAASRASSVYGRDNTNEVRPNAVTGIWIIRANGAFQAANTEFNCISSDAVDPPVNTTVHGGLYRSNYFTNGSKRISAGMYANYTWGVTASEASNNIDVVVYDQNGKIVANSTMLFKADGSLTLPGVLNFGTGTTTPSVLSSARTGSGQGQVDLYTPGGTTRLAVGGGYVTRRGVKGPWGANGEGNLFNFDWQGPRDAGGDVGVGTTTLSFPGIGVWIDTTHVAALAAIRLDSSDRLLKKDIAYRNHQAESLAEVMQWKTATFKYKARGVIPETGTMLGFIADDLLEHSPECVIGKGLKEGYDPLHPEDAHQTVGMAMTAKMVEAMQAQQALIVELQERIAKLEAKLEA
ncbi:hypothetical protein GJ904_17735 [Salmonella enterica]|nr:tail fiber domain-containing protein [Salmonella enterica subsp. enterica serovar Saintpaul]EEC1302914.1 hypothetical protein [Salmonella enterica]